MNVSLELNPDTADKVARAASLVGKDVPSFLKEFVDRSFAGALTAPRSVDEILAPFRAEIERSGLNDQQLESLFVQGRDLAFAARSRSGKG